MHPIATILPPALLTLLCCACGSSAPVAPEPTAQAATNPAETGDPAMDFYSLKTTSLDGQPVDLSIYRGKVTLVVNVASACGYTPQYKGLQQLHSELAPRGFAVLGFPSNDFGGQEPGSAEEIRAFCTTRFGVSFPMFAKVRTKTGTDQSPVYALLGEQGGQLPNWNFCKYLVGKDGKVIAFYPSRTTPDSTELRQAIEQAL